jgi:Na+-transporting methylmalonyl-CoA/oxaloacetate decarboxylase gamma subunit
VEGEGTSLLFGTVVGVVLLVIVLIIMFMFDWEKHFAKYVEEPKTEDTAVAKKED